MEHSSWVCKVCTVKRDKLKIFDIMTNSGPPGSNGEKTELEARLSVFDHYMFLLDEGVSAPLTRQIRELQSSDGLLDKCPNRTEVKLSSPEKPPRRHLASVSASDVMDSGSIGSERETSDLEKRLSVFDEYLFFVDSKGDGSTLS